MDNETIIEHLKRLATTCNRSIELDILGLPWEPIGRGDTYLLQNTLLSLVKVLEKR